MSRTTLSFTGIHVTCLHNSFTTVACLSKHFSSLLCCRSPSTPDLSTDELPDDITNDMADIPNDLELNQEDFSDVLPRLPDDLQDFDLFEGCLITQSKTLPVCVCLILINVTCVYVKVRMGSYCPPQRRLRNWCVHCRQWGPTLTLWCAWPPWATWLLLKEWTIEPWLCFLVLSSRGPWGTCSAAASLQRTSPASSWRIIYCSPPGVTFLHRRHLSLLTSHRQHAPTWPHLLQQQPPQPPPCSLRPP